MNDPDRRNLGLPRLDSVVETSVVIAALHLAGADKFDPVGLYYLDVLARRTSARKGTVRRILDGKLTQAVVVFSERFERAQHDVKGVKQGVVAVKAGVPPASLGELARYITQRSPELVGGGFEGNAGLCVELETTQYFRNTWSKLSVDKRVTHALAQAPKNAGPINSHILVLRSLALMREISPDYLNHFTSYVDALLSLDQCDKVTRSGKPMPKKPLRQKAIKQ